MSGFDVISYSMGKKGTVPLLTKEYWNSLSTREKQLLGVVAVKQSDSGEQRGILVSGKDYWPRDAMRTNYINCAVPLSNWATNYSHNFELVFKHNDAPNKYGQWPKFLAKNLQANSNAMVVQHNFYSNRKVINVGWNNKWAGDQNYSYDSPYDYDNYYAVKKTGDKFTILKGVNLDNIVNIVGGGTLNGASVDAENSDIFSLFPRNPDNDSRMDTNFYWLKVWNNEGTLIHDYRPIADSTYNCVIYDRIDNSTLAPLNSGATYVPEISG